MMIYLLIDTCSYRQLVSTLEISKQLEQIQFWVDKKFITILVPEVLVTEWSKHKEEQRFKIRQSVEKQARQLEKFRFTSDVKKEASEHLEIQLDQIDKLLSSGIRIPETDELKRIGFDKRRLLKAPYHNSDKNTNKNNDNDFLLIYSTLMYLKENNISSFVFLSDNFTEFAIKVKSRYELHEDFLDDFPGLESHYFTKPQIMIDWLGSIHGLEFLPVSNDEETELNDVLSIDKTKSVIDQLDEYIRKRFNGISYYPINLLKNDFPFRTSSEVWPSYDLFSMSTDNDILFNILDSSVDAEGLVNVTDPIHIGVKDANTKLEQSIRKLNSNLIFTIKNKRLNKRKYIRLAESDRCECYRCCYNRFELSAAINKLNQEVSSIDDGLKSAYIHYQTGNFLAAFNVLKSFIETPSDSVPSVSLIIASYNFSKLRWILDRFHFSGEYNDLAKSELIAFNLEAHINKYRRVDNSQFSDFLMENKFITEAVKVFYKLVNEIRENYFIQLKGGISTNYKVWELINCFSELDSFLNLNYVLYDQTGEFTDSFAVFTEGIIISHSIPNEMGSKLEYINDYLLKRMVEYGNPDRMRKDIVDYNLREFLYAGEESEDGSFIKLSYNLLDSYSDIMLNNHGTLTKDQKPVFWRKYNNMLSNLCLMWMYLKIDSQSLRTFSSKLIPILLHKQEIYPRTIDFAVGYYTRSDVPYSQSEKEEILELFINQYYLHSPEYFEVLTDLLIAGEKMILNELQFQSLINLHFDHEPQKSGIPTAKTIVYFWGLLDSKQQELVMNKITDRFAKTYFDVDLYYNLVLHGLSNDTGHFEYIWDAYMPGPDAKSMRSLLLKKEEERFESVNAILNFIFHTNLILDNAKIERIKSIDPYYEWLMDLDGFDYLKFNPYWLTEHNTIPFLRRLKASEKLKAHLKVFLRDNSNPTILKQYFVIFEREL